MKRVTLQLRLQSRPKCCLIKLRIQIKIVLCTIFMYSFPIIQDSSFLITAYNNIFIPYLAVTTANSVRTLGSVIQRTWSIITASVVNTLTVLKNISKYCTRIPLLVNHQPCFLAFHLWKHVYETTFPVARLTVATGYHAMLILMICIIQTLEIYWG